MEKNSMLSCNHSDFFDGLNRTDLIICKHNGNQDCFRSNGLFQILQTDDSVFIYVKVGDLCSSFFQVFACMKNSMMLDLCCNYVITFCFVCFKSSL